MSQSTSWIIVIYVFASICLWCCLSHCIFMRFCTCLKRPQKIRQASLYRGPKGWLLNGAHRGGSSEKPENTTDAFKHALAKGLNFMECDVQISKDGQVVVAHDDTLERMCGNLFQGKRVRDYDFADLPKFQQEIPYHLEAGFYSLHKNEEGKFTLLEDLMKICDGVFISIDMKDATDELTQKVDEMVRRYKREDTTFWGSMFAE